jgi:hypothetical protein
MVALSKKPGAQLNAGLLHYASLVTVTSFFRQLPLHNLLHRRFALPRLSFIT